MLNYMPNLQLVGLDIAMEEGSILKQIKQTLV